MDTSRTVALTKVLRVIAIFCIVTLGLWACLIHSVVAVWHPPTSSPDVYRVSNNETSEALTYALMPSGKLVIVRTEGEHYCQWLGTVRGEYGHRVIPKVWYTPRHGWEWLNYKIVDRGYTPVSLEDEIEARAGDRCNGLAELGETVNFVAQFSRDSMRVSGMELLRVSDDDASKMKEIERVLQRQTNKRGNHNE